MFMLTANGIDIVDSGGWLAHLQRQVNEHNELIALRGSMEEFQRRHIRINTNLQRGMLVCAIVGAIGVVYGAVQASKNTKLEHQLETVLKERNQLSKERGGLDSLLETRDKEIRVLRQKIDSLNQPSKPPKKRGN